ncbi:MAG: type 4a pilus biogenesis protein PilO [Actinomycetota bacterium]
MRLKPTKATIALLGGVLALVIIGTGAIVWFQQKKLTETVVILKAREAEKADGHKIARQRDEMRVALEQDRAELLYLENGVSDAAYVPTLLKQLEELASTTHNRVLGVRPIADTRGPTRIEQRRDPNAQAKAGSSSAEKEEAPPEPYTRLAIQVSLVGSYQSSQAFVDRLTRFPKIVSVEELQLRPQHAVGLPAAKDQGLLDVEVKLTAFIMKDAPAAVSSDASAVTAQASIGGSK